MPLESYDVCPSCGHKIVLTKSHAGSFLCPDCKCEFRHNVRKWIIGIPVGLAVVLLLRYVTHGLITSPKGDALLGVMITVFALSRIQSYIITKPGSLPSGQSKR